MKSSLLAASPALRDVGHASDAARAPEKTGRLVLWGASRVAALAVSLAGVAVLLGWVFNIASLKQLLPGLVAMNPMTACAFIAAGVGLFASGKPGHFAGSRFAGMCAVAVFLVGVAKLIGTIGGPDVGVDHWLFSSRLFDESGSPNRMAPNTAFNFLLIGGALWQLSQGGNRMRRVWASQLLASAACLSAGLALLGYLYNIHSLYGVGHFIPMALHTAFAFIVLAMGILCARADQGVMAPITSYSAGGAMARRLLPAAILIPVVFGWFRLQGQRLGYFDAEFGVALFVIFNVGLFASLIWWTASVLHRTDRARQQAVIQIRATSQELENSNSSLSYKNDQMEADLDLAREIQQAFLPQQFISLPNTAPPSESVLRFHHRYEPTATLGGDFSDILLISDTQAGIFVCDVMGHGVRSALVTAILRGLVEENLKLAGEPGAFMAAINRSLITILKRTRMPLFASAFYLFANTKTGLMHFVSAGHPSPLLAEAALGTVRFLLPDANDCGPALGVFEDATYPTHECALSPHDLVVLYTDGLVESSDDDGEEYGEDRLQNAIATRMPSSPDDLLDQILQEAREFSKTRQFEDDVCLVGMEIGPDIASPDTSNLN